MLLGGAKAEGQGVALGLKGDDCKREGRALDYGRAREMHEQCKAMCEALGGCAGVSAGAAFWPRANAESPPHIPSLLLHDAIEFAASETTSTSARSGECHVTVFLLSFLPGSLRPSCKLVHFPPPPHAELFTRSSSNKHTSWCTPVDPPGHVFGVTYRGISLPPSLPPPLPLNPSPLSKETQLTLECQKRPISPMGLIYRLCVCL